MELWDLIANEEAVSPVIGVTLMVAITVILAAVMGSFALGINDQTETSPTTDFTFEYVAGQAPPNGSVNDDGSDTLTIIHDSGQNIPAEVIYIRGETAAGTSVPSGSTWTDAGGSTSTDVDGESAIASGDSATVGVESTYHVRVVWQPSESQKSTTLSSHSGPDRS